jgi:NitT/TauT family transport system substrate-binding protein
MGAGLSGLALTGLALTGLGGAVAACSPGGGEAGKVTAGGRTRIRFATDWRAQAEQGGWYQALATGLYADAGLDVTLIQGGPSVNVPQLLAAGAVELGMGSNSPIVLSMVQAGAGVKAVMASFQKDPQVLISHPRADITSIADMKGKPILLADASITAFWPWLKAKHGFTDDQVRKYTFNSAPFLADPQAIQQGYVTSEPYTLRTQGGIEPQVYLLADDGYPGYGAMILAPDRLIADNRAAVQAFVSATVEGWRSYLTGDPAPGDAAIREQNPDMTPELLANARQELVDRQIVIPTAGALGAMSEARWQEFTQVMASAGVVPATLDWRHGVDLGFVPAAG